MPRSRKTKSPRQTDQDVDSVWLSQPQTIKKFLDQRADYEQLCVEVAYILRKRIEAKDLEVAWISHRAKTLNSFLEKVQRKAYSNPFEEMEDFAGVRAVCLYASDLDTVEGIVQTEFEVLEKVDKFRAKAPDQFGYGAVHFIVRLGSGTLGARYDDLKDLKCELQVRTVLQDAWAIIDHHLVYKRQSDIPRLIQRKLNSLAGLLEVADDQFARIREERREYLDGLEAFSRNEEAFLATELNRDSFFSYVEKKFPGLVPEAYPGQINLVLDDIDRKRYPRLEELDTAIAPLAENSEGVVAGLPLKRESDSGALRAIVLLAVVDKKIRQGSHFPTAWAKPVEEAAQEFVKGE